MLFSEIVAALHQQDGDLVTYVPDTWCQGRTVFGGLQAAILIRAMRRHVGADVPLRSLQTAFVAPIPPGEVRASSALLRQGKSAAQVEARIRVGDAVGCIAIGVFGATRASSLSFRPARPPVPKAQDVAPKLPFLEGFSPRMSRQCDLRWGGGRFPYTGGPEPRTQCWVRFPGETRLDEALLTGLADSIPSPANSLLTRPVPASSMTWTLEFLSHDYDPAATDGWLLDAVADAAGDGYVYQTATLFGPDGTPVALSRQSVVVFG